MRKLVMTLIAVAVMALPLDLAYGRGGGGRRAPDRGPRAERSRKSRSARSVEDQRTRDRMEDRESARDCDRR